MIRELEIHKKNGDFFLTWINDEIYPLSTLSKMLMSNGVATFTDNRFNIRRTIIICLSEVSEFVVGEPVKSQEIA